jgi:hypothetical protein
VNNSGGSVAMRGVMAGFVIWCCTAATFAADLDFDRHVAPILAGRCLDCHSGSEPKGGLDLSSAKGATKGGESGEAAFVTGKPDASPLWQRIEANEMPPKHPLPEAERKVLKEWIAAGAKWGTDPIDPYRFSTAARAGYDWWSLQPLVRPAVPELRDTKAVIRNPIDAFVLAKLEEKGLTPSPPADARTLARRLSFDLIGLPPEPKDVHAFVAPSPTRPLSPSRQERERGREEEREKEYRELVDRLLGSPHYGERWARHWLDIARFGESDGYEYDRMRLHAWRYRDWVIEALNQDMPYDEFARLQLAGDVLRPSEAQGIIATGFLVAGAFDGLQPKGDVMKQIMRQDELEDLVAATSQTFLGLTVNCARCHDHKFDPVRQTDYYRIAAALAGVKRGDRELAPQKPPEDLVKRREQAAAELAAIETKAREAALAARAEGKSKRPDPPQPIAHWEFDSDLSDSIGQLHARAEGGAKLEAGGLILDGKTGYAVTPPLDREITAKTLEAWVQLSSLDQRGGGAISLQTPSGDTFDAIVFGEQQPRRWMAGSEFFRRTQGFDKGADESEARQRPVHVALVYAADGTIAAYRDGVPYGEPYKSSGPMKFEGGKSQIIFGLRHGPSGGNKMLAGRIERASLYDRALSAEEVAASAAAFQQAITEAELLAQLDEATKAKRGSLAAEIERLDAQVQSYQSRKTFAITPQPAPVVHLLVRGNVGQPGEAVAAGGVQSLAASHPDFALAADASDAERRKKLAEWIASKENPLFARTIVNRVWHYHFGRGLVETTSDLGFSGGQPSHPELLDWLASELIDKKWSLKELHRLIVTSATYRQASRPRAECQTVDADNRLLWRFSPRRLEAEAVRDATLVVAGQFNPQVGGPSVKDFRPFEYKTTQYYEPLDPVGHEFNRRSIYRMWARGGKSPLLDTFDCPDPSTATPRRGTTTTPLQALALLNNSFTLRMADHFAERVTKERPEGIESQSARALELAYGRTAAKREAAAAVEFAKQHGLPAFCRVLLNTNGFLYVD